MVTISLLAALETGKRHEVTGRPSIITVQARHCPSPQPYLDPVSCKSSRSTSNSERSPSEVTVLILPLIFNFSVTSTRNAPPKTNDVRFNPTSMTHPRFQDVLFKTDVGSIFWLRALTQ